MYHLTAYYSYVNYIVLDPIAHGLVPITWSLWVSGWKGSETRSALQVLGKGTLYLLWHGSHRRCCCVVSSKARISRMLFEYIKWSVHVYVMVPNKGQLCYKKRAVQVHDPSVRSCPCIIMELHFACFSDIICLSLEVHLTSQFCTHSNATIFRCARWTNRRMATTLPTCSLSWWSTIFSRGTHQCCLCYMRYIGFTTNCIYSVTNVLVCMIAIAR